MNVERLGEEIKLVREEGVAKLQTLNLCFR